MKARDQERQVVLIEGADGTGKTTLAEAFQDRGFQYVHQGPFDEDPFWETLFLVHNRPQKLVLDRSHLGEQVYGPLYREEDALGHARRRMIDRYLLARGGIVVVAEPPYEEAQANWAEGKERGEEMFEDRIGHWKSYQRFGAMISTMYSLTGPGALPDFHSRPRTELPVVRFDYTSWDSGLDAFAEQVLERAPDRNRGPGIGHWSQGGIVLVGHRANPRTNPMYLPFVSDQGCAPWLAAKLEQWGVAEAELYWVNAEDDRGLETDGRFLQYLQPRRVIALGNEAQRWVKRRSLPAETEMQHVPHPQYWRRFHHHKEYPLRRLLS